MTAGSVDVTRNGGGGNDSCNALHSLSASPYASLRRNGNYLKVSLNSDDHDATSSFVTTRHDDDTEQLERRT